MKLSRLLLVLAGVLGLSACATPWQVAEVQDIKTTVATGGTAFTAALLDEYKEQARVEAEVEVEWRHAVIFARKGARAAVGELVLPEELAAWEIPAPAIPALAGARALLMDDFDKGARERSPALAAKAQASFDCWLEEEWEGDPDTSCKDAFFAAEAQLKPPAPLAPPAALAPPKTFAVFFDFDRAGVSAQAKAVLAEVAKAQGETHAPVLHISGFTDTVGTKRYNHKLSIRRAQAVAQALTKLGIPDAQLDVKGYGKEHLAVPTKDNVKEPRNRRVEIVFGAEHRVAATAPVAAIPAAAVIAAPQPAPTGDGNFVLGMLTCAKSGDGTTYLLFSRSPVECRYDGIGGTRKYAGTTGILFGADLQIEPMAGMGYLVLGASWNDKAGLEGSYVGAKASATLGVGPAVQGGIGGAGNGITLVPFGLGGQTGIGFTAGLSYLDIQAAR